MPTYDVKHFGKSYLLPMKVSKGIAATDPVHGVVDRLLLQDGSHILSIQIPKKLFPDFAEGDMVMMNLCIIKTDVETKSSLLIMEGGKDAVS